MSKHSYTSRLAEVANSAIIDINNYEGKKAVMLPTGEKAIDNDDAWLIIGGAEPILRDKREQRIREAYKHEGKEYPEIESSDYFILDKWEYEEICAFADKLFDLS